jgi:EAL domain-containing protein (putative c-di-GMP-specific phosphodiesterase class I)
VQRSASDGQTSAVLGSVVELAARSGALVIAEGIEQAVQLAQVSSLGIEAGQGYFIGRPGPLEAPGPVAKHEPLASVGIAAWRQSMGLSSVS